MDKKLCNYSDCMFKCSDYNWYFVMPVKCTYMIYPKVEYSIL